MLNYLSIYVTFNRLTREEITKIDSLCLNLKQCAIANRARVSPPNSSQEAANNEVNSVEEDQNNNNNENEEGNTNELLEEMVEEKPMVVPQHDLREASVEKIDSDSDETLKESVSVPRKRKAKKLKSSTEESESDEIPDVKPVNKRRRIIQLHDTSSDENEKRQNDSTLTQRRYSRSSKKSTASDTQISKHKIPIDTETLTTAQKLAAQAGVELTMTREFRDLCINIVKNPHESPFDKREKRTRKKVNYSENSKTVEHLEEEVIEKYKEQSSTDTSSSGSSSEQNTNENESSDFIKDDQTSISESSDGSDRENSPIRQYRLDDFKFDLNITKLPGNIISRARIVDGKIIPHQKSDDETYSRVSVLESYDKSSESFNKRSRMREFKCSQFRSSLLREAEQQVANISFTKCTSGYMFRCHYDSCTNYTIHKEVFKNHISAPKHINSIWNGFCKICGKTVSSVTNLIDEFAHMIYHIEGHPNQMKQTARKSTTNTNIEKHDQHGSAIQSTTLNTDELNKTFIIQEEEPSTRNAFRSQIKMNENPIENETHNGAKSTDTSDIKISETQNNQNKKTSNDVNQNGNVSVEGNENHDIATNAISICDNQEIKQNNIINIPESIETISSEDSLTTQTFKENSKTVQIPDSIETISSEENSDTRSIKDDIEVISIPNSIESISEEKGEFNQQKNKSSISNPPTEILDSLGETIRTKEKTSIEIFDSSDKSITMNIPERMEKNGPSKAPADLLTTKVIDTNEHGKNSPTSQKTTEIDESQNHPDNNKLEDVPIQSSKNIQKGGEEKNNAFQRKLVYVVKTISPSPGSIPTQTTTQVTNVAPQHPIQILPTTTKVLYSAPKVSLPFNYSTTEPFSSTPIMAVNQAPPIASNSIVISNQLNVIRQTASSTSVTQIQNTQILNFVPQANASDALLNRLPTQQLPQKINPQLKKISSLQCRRESIACEKPPYPVQNQVNVPPRRASISTYRPKVITFIVKPNPPPTLSVHEASANANIELLRPWLKDTKSKAERSWMFSENALKNLFKCMKSTCNFHTDSYVDFYEHNISEQGRKECPYCLYDTENGKDLANHIIDVHGSSIVACGHCLYRTSYRWHIEAHFTKYHKNLPKIFLVCKLQKKINHQEDLKVVKANRSKFILPIICCGE